MDYKKHERHVLFDSGSIGRHFTKEIIEEANKDVATEIEVSFIITFSLSTESFP